MARKIKVVECDKYGIKVTHRDGTAGWVVGADGQPLLLATEKEANKALKGLKQMDYSWNCEVAVCKYDQ